MQNHWLGDRKGPGGLKWLRNQTSINTVTLLRKKIKILNVTVLNANKASSEVACSAYTPHFQKSTDSTPLRENLEERRQE